MKTLAIISSKIISTIGNSLGRGSSLPGKLAGQIDSRILAKLDLPLTIMISGTNGKTSTSHFISSILSKENVVVHNSEGANMPQGIATILLKNSDLSGKVKADYTVLEVDEGFLHLITDDIKADYFVLTNISQDQIDRFTSLEMVEDLILQGINDGATIIANGNDPTIVDLTNKIDNKAVFYGADLRGGQASFSCPACGRDLNYREEYYGNIGLFDCQCGLKSPDIDYLAENINLEEGSFEVKGHKFKTNYHADYMVYNLMAAISLAMELGINVNTIRDALATYQIGGGRMEKLSFAGKDTILNLVKNPAGLSRTLDYIARDEEAYNIYFAINKKPADGEDISWLNNVDFSIVNPLEFVVEGEAGGEAKEILKNKGVEISKLSLEELAKSQNKTYFLTNYTALGTLKEKLKAFK